MINSRPLTYNGDDIRDGRIITSALLAIGGDVYQITLPREQLCRSLNIIDINNDFKITFGPVRCENTCLDSLFVKSGQEKKFH